jgi:hypothetical protein
VVRVEGDNVQGSDDIGWCRGEDNAWAQGTVPTIEAMPLRCAGRGNMKGSSGAGERTVHSRGSRDTWGRGSGDE